MPYGWKGKHQPGGKYWPPTTGFKTHSPVSLAAKRPGSAPSHMLDLEYGTTFTLSLPQAYDVLQNTVA